MDYEQIKKLMDDMGESKLTSVDIEFPDGIKISMKKDEKVNEGIACGETVKRAQVVTNEAETKIEVEEVKKGKVITSPMVGTFYSKPAPTAEPFVKKGDKVKKGDVLCIIEAMKLMNEIESELDGEIVEVLVNDGEMVEYGKELFRIC